VGVVACVGFVLEGCGIDGDAPGLFFWGLVDFGVLDVLGLLLGGQVLGDGGREGGFAVVDVADRTD